MKEKDLTHIKHVFEHDKKVTEAYLFEDGNVFTSKQAADNYRRELNQDKKNGRYKGEINYETVTREGVEKLNKMEAKTEDPEVKKNAQEYLKLKSEAEIEAENYKKLLDVAKDLGLKHKNAIKKVDLAALLVEQKKNLENVG